MKINKTFTYTTSDARDNSGWVPNWIKGFDATAGFGLAHDVLEHNHSPIASVENECIALGTLLWGRGQAGYWENYMGKRGNWTFHENVIGDVVEFLSKADYCSPARKRRFQLDDWIEEELDLTHKAVVEQWNSYKYDSEKQWSPERIAELARNAISWMHYGFRVADRRYASINACHLCDIFWQIENDEYVKAPEDMNVREGDVLHVNVLVERAIVRIWINDGRDQ